MATDSNQPETHMSDDSNKGVAKAIKFVGILGVLVIMALTNPSEKDFVAATGDARGGYTSFIICSFYHYRFDPAPQDHAFGLFGHVYK